MKCERQDFFKLFLAALLAVVVVFSFQATLLLGQQENTQLNKDSYQEKSVNDTSTEKSRKDFKIIKCKILRRNPIRPPPL